jgi:hypothetical protein
MFRCVYTFDSESWMTYTLSMYDFFPLFTHLNIIIITLKLMGQCIVYIFQYVSNKMQRYTVYLYLETAVHVSGGTPIHHQEQIQLYLQQVAVTV